MGMVWEAYWEGGPTFGDLWRNALSGNHPFSKIILSKNTWICLKRFAVHNKIHHHFFTTICKNTFRIFFQALYANPIKTLKDHWRTANSQRGAKLVPKLWLKTLYPSWNQQITPENWWSENEVIIHPPTATQKGQGSQSQWQLQQTSLLWECLGLFVGAILWFPGVVFFRMSFWMQVGRPPGLQDVKETRSCFLFSSFLGFPWLHGSTNGELLVWGPLVWDSNRVPLSNNPFHRGNLLESKPPITQTNKPNH